MRLQLLVVLFLPLELILGDLFLVKDSLVHRGRVIPEDILHFLQASDHILRAKLELHGVFLFPFLSICIQLPPSVYLGKHRFLIRLKVSRFAIIKIVVIVFEQGSFQFNRIMAAHGQASL